MINAVEQSRRDPRSIARKEWKDLMYSNHSSGQPCTFIPLFLPASRCRHTGFWNTRYRGNTPHCKNDLDRKAARLPSALHVSGADEWRGDSLATDCSVGPPVDIANRAKTIFVEPISNIHPAKNFGGPLDSHQSRCWLLNQGFLRAELAEGTSCIREVFPPIFAKIGEVQRNLDSSENPICSRVWATYT
jgi:hypothetical protein